MFNLFELHSNSSRHNIRIALHTLPLLRTLELLCGTESIAVVSPPLHAMILWHLGGSFAAEA